MLLLKYNADVNLRSIDGRTPLMWATMKGNLTTMELLIENGAKLDLTDQEGLNCFDLAVIKLRYEAAKYLFDNHGMTRSKEERELLYTKDAGEHQFNIGKLYRTDFDIDMFFSWLETGRKEVDIEELFKKKQEEYKEWASKDLVVDTRESWREWIKRQAEFKDPPLVPREELPEAYHPHRSFYGKLSNTLNGIDPTPPERKSTVAREMVDLETNKEAPG